MSSFADLGVSRPVADALTKRGITAPFAVQKLVIEDVLDGHDVLVQSPTGSGKTLAFGIPLVDLIEADDRRPAALILAPTRELALQIVDELREIADRPGALGRPRLRRRRAREAGQARPLAPTSSSPPRAGSRTCSTAAPSASTTSGSWSSTRPTGCSTWASSPPSTGSSRQTPGDRQTLFFSATLEAAAGKVATRLHPRARRHVHEPVEADQGETSHRFVHLDHDAKVDALVAELRDSERGRTLVFVRTKHGADRLVKRLASAGSRRWRCTATRARTSASARSPVRRGRRRHPGRDRRRRPRDRRRGHHPRDQLRRPRRSRRLRPPRRAHRARRAATAPGSRFVLPDQDAEMRKIAVSLGLGAEFDHARPAHVSARGHDPSCAALGRSPSSPAAPLRGVLSCNRSYEGSDLVPL